MTRLVILIDVKEDQKALASETKEGRMALLRKYGDDKAFNDNVKYLGHTVSYKPP